MTGGGTEPLSRIRLGKTRTVRWSDCFWGPGINSSLLYGTGVLPTGVVTSLDISSFSWIWFRVESRMKTAIRSDNRIWMRDESSESVIELGLGVDVRHRCVFVGREPTKVGFGLY